MLDTDSRRCDKYSNTIVVLKNNYNKIIGGTNVGSWSSSHSGSSTVGQSPHQKLFSVTANRAFPRQSSSYYATYQCGSSYGPYVRDLPIL